MLTSFRAAAPTRSLCRGLQAACHAPIPDAGRLRRPADTQPVPLWYIIVTSKSLRSYLKVL